MRVEEEHADVLQNIEFAIVTTYRERPDLCDADVLRVLGILIDGYVAEKLGRPPRHSKPSDAERALLEGVRAMCEWRLGRQPLGGDAEKEGGIAPEPKSVDVILLCLKRLVKSVQKWNRAGGRRGYLDFIVNYVR